MSRLSIIKKLAKEAAEAVSENKKVKEDILRQAREEDAPLLKTMDRLNKEDKYGDTFEKMMEERDPRKIIGEEIEPKYIDDMIEKDRITPKSKLDDNSEELESTAKTKPRYKLNKTAIEEEYRRTGKLTRSEREWLEKRYPDYFRELDDREIRLMHLNARKWKDEGENELDLLLRDLTEDMDAPDRYRNSGKSPSAFVKSDGFDMWGYDEDWIARRYEGALPEGVEKLFKLLKIDYYE